VEKGNRQRRWEERNERVREKGKEELEKGEMEGGGVNSYELF